MHKSPYRRFINQSNKSESTTWNRCIDLYHRLDRHIYLKRITCIDESRDSRVCLIHEGVGFTTIQTSQEKERDANTSNCKKTRKWAKTVCLQTTSSDRSRCCYCLLCPFNYLRTYVEPEAGCSQTMAHMLPWARARSHILSEVQMLAAAGRDSLWKTNARVRPECLPVPENGRPQLDQMVGPTS